MTVLSEPVKHLLDYSLAIVAVVAAKLLHHVPETLACLLVITRILVGAQEYRLNRRKLGGRE